MTAAVIVVIIIILLIGAASRKKRRRRVRGYYKRAIRPPVTLQMRRTVFRRDKGKCRHCGITEAQCMARTGRHLQYDHIIPFSRGGATNVGNLQLLCPTCNMRKGNRFIG